MPVDPPRPHRYNRFRRGVIGVCRGIVRGLALTRVLLLVLVTTGALLRPSTVLAAEWIQNRVATDLWASPEPDARSLGQAPAGDYFQVMTQAPNDRLLVFVARLRSRAFIDTANVVSSGPPSRDWLRQISQAGPADPVVESTRIVPSLSLAAFPIRADPNFTPALEQLLALQHTWTLQALAATGTRLEWTLMAPDAAGSVRPDLGAIRFNARWYKSDSRALAALVEHEAKHVADALAGLDVASPTGCVMSEVNAFREEAKTWGEMVGLAGKPDPQDDLERSLNSKLSIYQQQPDTIQALITRSPGYQRQCKLR